MANVDYESEKIWQSKKSQLLKSIDELLEKENAEKETLKVMKALLEQAKVRVSMENFMEEQLEEL
jgi:hypothetical protein